MPQKTPNIEHYPNRKTKQYRIRFNVGSKLQSFGYYESYSDALILRNLIAMRMGLETVLDDIFSAFSDNHIELVSDEYAHILEKAEELGEHKQAVVSQKIGSVPTRKLQEQINELTGRLGDLESQVRLIQQRLNAPNSPI